MKSFDFGKMFLFFICAHLFHLSLGNLIFANSKDLRMVLVDTKRQEMSVIVDNLGDATALDFLFKPQVVFWSDLGTEKIQGVRLGEKSKKPFDVINVSSPDGLAVDWLTNKIYWADSDNKRLEVCQIDKQFKGINRKVLFSKDLDAPRAICLVPQEGLLFWSDWGDKPKIERASMDGKQRRVLISEEVRWPNGLAADYEARRIYWVDAKLKFISSVDYNGKNRKKLLSNLPHSFGLTIDKDLLYMTDWTNMGISSCNKSTEKCKLLLPSLKHQSNQLYPMGIKVLASHVQPENMTGCDINNGGCSHLCLLSSYSPGYSCACPTGVLLTSDNKTCAKSEEKFIVLLRKTDIRKISLDTEDHIDVVLPYPKEIKHAISVDYDPIEGRIYWTDDDAKAIRRAHLNSSQLESVINSDLRHPDGIAIDWLARNLYFTDTGTNTIQVSRLDGSFRKTLISTDLDEPRAIVVDPWKGLMFWSDWGANDPKIEKASLDGSSREKIVSKELAWPNGLAIDMEEEKIFWGDAKMDRIETCDYNGGSRKLLVKNVEHPFGLTVLDDFVYWTDWQERAIHRTNKRVGGKSEVLMDLLPDMMGLKAISVHQDLGLDLDLGCSKFNGGCQQLCLERYQRPYVCSCANGWELDFDDKGCKRIKSTTPSPRNDRRTSLLSSPNSRKSCPDDRVACVSGQIDCVSSSHICDGENDCTDGSDEHNCCPPGRYVCPSNPSICLDLTIICDKHSPCTDPTLYLLELCAKSRVQNRPSSSPPGASLISSSQSLSSSISSSPSPNVNDLTTNNGLPIIGVVAAVAIVILLCCFAFRMTSQAVHQPVMKLQPLSVPLMQRNASSSGPESQCLEVRVTPRPYSPQPAVPLKISSPPPDLLMSDSSRCETNSLSGIESVSRFYPLVPPPSPATNVSRSSCATWKYKNRSSESSIQ